MGPLKLKINTQDLAYPHPEPYIRFCLQDIRNDNCLLYLVYEELFDSFDGVAIDGM
jgi:hypothetical protein